MTLFIDPAVQAEFTEPPYTEERGQRLYAPVAPFAEAIERWLDYQHRQMGVPIRDCRHKRSDYNLMAEGIASLQQLAELAGITARTLNRYRNEGFLIELRNADRLALALDIPLVLLAEEFKPMGEALAQKRRAA